MNKKYLSVILFGALMLGTAGTFTSCKDYDDDIKHLQEQIDQKGTELEDLSTQFNTLNSALDAVKKTAEDAKAAAATAQAAADAAQATGDEALAQAKEAEANAQRAIAAAATAKEEAIEEAKKEIADLKALLEEQINGKVSEEAFAAFKEVYEAAVSELGGKIEGIQAGLNTLTDNVAKNTEDIKNIYGIIGTTSALQQDLLTQIKALQEYATLCGERFDAQDEQIKSLQTELETANKNIADLREELLGEINGLDNLLSALRDDYDTFVNVTFKEYQEKIGQELTEIKSDITEIKGDISAINKKISEEIMPDLALLHTLITSRLTSITFAPSYFVDGIEAIKFSSLNYSAMDENENAEIPDVYKFSTANLATASYHFNPASFNLKNATYQYVDRQAEVSTTRAASQLVTIEGVPEMNAITGTVDFKLRRLNAYANELPNNANENKVNIIALQATLQGDAIDENESNVVVTSPYVRVADVILSKADIRIADKETLGADNGVAAHYALTFNQCTEESPRYPMAYDKIFNLKDLVATCFGNGVHKEFPVEDYNLSYRFAVASSEYKVASGQTETDQQKWIECTDAEAGTFKATGFNKEAIGRTPILKVELVDEAGNVVRRGFVKVEIVAEKSDDMYIGDGIVYEDIIYTCANTLTEKYTISEDYLRENLYRVITNGKESSMSHEEFWNTYEYASAVVTKNGVYNSTIDKPELVDGYADDGKATKKVTWQFKHGQVGEIGVGGANLVATLVVKNKLASSEYPELIYFRFNVKVVLPTFTLNKQENDLYWLKDGESYVAYKVNVEVPETTQSPAEDCIFNRSLLEAYSTYEIVANVEACTEDYYEVIATYNNGVQTTLPMRGVQINGVNISLDKSDAEVKAALNSENGLQAAVAHRYKLESGDVITVNEFMVTFIRPVNLNMLAGVTVTDAIDGGDVANFQHNGLLTDWRGEAIFAPDWEMVTKTYGYWAYNYVPEFIWTEGHYELVKAAEFSVERETVSLTVGTDLKMYTGSAQYKFLKVGFLTWEEGTKTFYVKDLKLTKDAVDAELEAQVQEFMSKNSLIYARYEKVGETQYEEKVISASQQIEYTYIKDIKYVSAEYEWIEGSWEMVKHIPTRKPTYEGTTVGQVDGDWKWIVKSYEKPELIPGQYWDFYGRFSDVKLDLDNVRTSLDYNGNRLPSDVTLIQSGNTVKYVNVGSPVTYTYTITIPVSINYGWGTVSTELVITVNPKN